MANLDLDDPPGIRALGGCSLEPGPDPAIDLDVTALGGCTLELGPDPAIDLDVTTARGAIVSRRARALSSSRNVRTSPPGGLLSGS